MGSGEIAIAIAWDMQRGPTNSVFVNLFVQLSSR